MKVDFKKCKTKRERAKYYSYDSRAVNVVIILNFMITNVMARFSLYILVTSHCEWAVIICQFQREVRGASITQFRTDRYLN
jgi:hypothetical protein